uniref:Uncharacterized protein n=1 Tax=Octopus bimaculoides TaxID=37653 RepID=A0A0L8G482_OCTBM
MTINSLKNYLSTSSSPDRSVTSLKKKHKKNRNPENFQLHFLKGQQVTRKKGMLSVELI